MLYYTVQWNCDDILQPSRWFTVGILDVFVNVSQNPMVRYGQLGWVDGLQCLQFVHLCCQTLYHLFRSRHVLNDDTYDRTSNQFTPRYTQFSTMVGSVEPRR